jgi:fructose-1,6-bisphosphatase
MTDGRTTLSRFILEEQRKARGATGELTALLSDLVGAVKAIASLLGKGGLAGVLGDAGGANAQGEAQKKLDVLANELLLETCEWSGHLAGMV